jgi:hypothetical protein
MSDKQDGQSQSPEINLWPPEGFHSYYRVTERLEGYADFSYDFVLPNNFQEVDLSTVRLGRHGGPNARDSRFRRELHEKVGAIAVAGGHVEMAMKRLLLVLTSPPKAHFSLVDETWATLIKKLVKQCTGSDERRIQLATLLDWAEENKLKDRRDRAIHADWWDYHGVGIRRSRFERGNNGKMINSTLSDLGEDAALLSHFAGELDSLLGNDWIIARLPGPHLVRPGVAASTLSR